MSGHEALADEDKQLDASYFRMKFPNELVSGHHVHAQGQLFSIERGLCIVETSAGEWLFPPKRCGWIPPDHEHSVRSVGDVEGWTLYVNTRFCQTLPRQPMVMSLSPLLREMTARIATWQSAPPKASSREAFLEVLVDEVRLAREEPLSLPMPSDPRLIRLAEEISIYPEIDRPHEWWARRLGMSESSMQREFQKETGMTIGQWKQQLRILVALERLSGGMSVTDTTFAVGYSDVSAFIRAFKRIVGTTPLAYSKK